MQKDFPLEVYIEKVWAFIACRKWSGRLGNWRNKCLDWITPDKGEDSGAGKIGEGPSMRDQKRIILERSEGRGNRKAKKRMRQLSITAVIIRAEVVKALQTRSNLHRTPHLQNRPHYWQVPGHVMTVLYISISTIDLTCKDESRALRSKRRRQDRCLLFPALGSPLTKKFWNHWIRKEKG